MPKIEFDLPDVGGFIYTGEIRRAKNGEYRLNYASENYPRALRVYAGQETDEDCIIMRPAYKYQPPEITPEDVYEKEILAEIDYSKVLAFLPPKAGVKILSTYGDEQYTTGAFKHHHPRFILKGEK